MERRSNVAVGLATRKTLMLSVLNRNFRIVANVSFYFDLLSLIQTEDLENTALYSLTQSKGKS